ncbi:Gfo/Idh/MocA family protein [Halobacterium wangiae]|uniref:Gfo/Idh/MocA family protein n=1 Tax=Halobacterium wangiae TaxID=2902623 RepID=UPI001E642040|nr:Gfo/Idh/MocA family oxidoreductase [Halobacterium wangiae]
MTLRTAVVGGGTVSEQHLSGLDQGPRTELVAICDTDEDTAREIAEDYDIHAFFDVEEMLDELDLDWVHLCTPVQTHLPIAKLVIEAGIPVQIEKPITETYEEFEELAAHADRHGVTVTEVHNHNFVPAMRKAMQMKRDGELGAVRGVDVIYTGSSRPDDPNRGPWNFELAGGEFEEGLPHPIYLTLRAGGYPRSQEDVVATTSLFDEYDRDFDYDNAQLQYVTEDGVLCTTKVLSDTVPVRQILIHGEEKSLTVDLISQTIEEHDRDYLASPMSRGLNNVDSVLDRVTGTVKNVRSMVRSNRNDDWDTTRLNNPHFYQHDAEARALESGDEMPVPLAEARWTVYLMEAIRNAATRSGRRDAQPVEHSIGQDAE